MSEVIPPVLPDCLVADWEINPTLQERHAQLQSTDFQEYAATMPAVQRSVGGLHYADTFKHDPHSVEDEKSAVIVPIPFATGWRPHMAARVDLLNAALGGGQRMIALPNSVHGTLATQYTRHERHLMSRGNLAPLEEKVARFLDNEKIERVSVAGYSQGAVVAASVARAVSTLGGQQLEAAALSDMPTVVERSAGRFAADFVRTGMNSYVQAMDHTTIPFLRQSVTPVSRAASAREFGQYMRTVWIPENQALARGMRFATFGSVLLQAACGNDAQFGLMRAQNSTVTPKEPYEAMVANTRDYLGDRLSSLEVPGFGHEFGDHSVALALVEARTLAQN